MDRAKEDVITQQTTQLINDAKRLRGQDTDYWKHANHRELIQEQGETIHNDTTMLAADDWKTFGAIKKNIDVYNTDPANENLPKIHIEQGVRQDWYDHVNIGGGTTLEMDGHFTKTHSPFGVLLGNLLDESWDYVRKQF
jgi:hypothetical protein